MKRHVISYSLPCDISVQLWTVGPLVENHQSRMMKTRLVSFDGLLFMTGQADPCEVLSEKLSCNLPTKAPEGQSESPVAHPNHFCFVLHRLHHEETAFWMASSLVCSCSACVKHIPTDPSFSVHVKENRCFTMCKSMQLFQSRAEQPRQRKDPLATYVHKLQNTNPQVLDLIMWWLCGSCKTLKWL